MPKITNGTSGEQQILLKHQGSYGQQIPGCIFTSTHRGRHQRAKPNRFAARRGFWGGAVLPERNTSALGNDTVPAARPATGQPHSAILKIAPFLVGFRYTSPFFQQISARNNCRTIFATPTTNTSKRAARPGMVCYCFFCRSALPWRRNSQKTTSKNPIDFQWGRTNRYFAGSLLWHTFA